MIGTANTENQHSRAVKNEPRPDELSQNQVVIRALKVVPNPDATGLAPLVSAAADESQVSAVHSAGEVRVIKTSEAFLALKAEWNELFASAEVNHPFLAFEWLTTWWRQMRPKAVGAWHHLHIIAVYGEGRLQAAVPMFSSVFAAPGIGLKMLRPLGVDPNITELHGMLVRPGFEARAVALLDRYLKDTARDYDLVRWPDMPLEAMNGIVVNKGVIENFVLPLPATWEEFRAGLKRNIKESLRKCYNAPARDQIDLRFEVLDQADAVTASLPEFFRLHALRAQKDGGPSHPDYFAAPAHRAFLVDLIAQSRSVRPVMMRVMHGDKVVAARLGFIQNSALYLYFSGYDPELAAYSVATRLVAEAIQFAIGRGLKTLNLSTHSDVSKLRWSPQSIPYGTLSNWSTSWRGRGLARTIGCLPVFKRKGF